MGNVMYADDLHVAALLDWEVASIAPPEIDVGYWLMMDDFHSDANGVARLPGTPDREQTLARYEEKAGRTLGDIGYFELLGAAQMAITLIRQSDARAGHPRRPRPRRQERQGRTGRLRPGASAQACHGLRPSKRSGAPGRAEEPIRQRASRGATTRARTSKHKIDLRQAKYLRMEFASPPQYRSVVQ